MTQPRLHSTPDEACTDRVREKVTLEGMTFHLERPAGLDKVFEHPGVRNAYAADEYIPYWTDLWAAGRMLAKVVLREDWAKYPRGSDGELDVLEIGCGLGLGGIAALACRLRVTFSDVDEMAVRFAVENAKRNGHANARSLPLDLRSPPPGVTFPVIIASDVMYEERLVEPVAKFIQAVLVPGGTALVTDPDRNAARSFRWVCGEVGLDVETSFVRAGEPGGERTKGTLYRLRHMT
jgi:predicted nicotinamide N-methyase